MVFTKQHIPAKLLCVIDIGSYKLRVCAASFKNKRIEVLGYTEKRQDSSYFSNQECTNLPGLCRNISEAIEKIEKEIGQNLEEIVVNYPFGDIFLESKMIHHIRKSPNIPLEEIELEAVLEAVEKHCLTQLSHSIENLYGLGKDEVQILLSRVNSISIDGRKEEKIMHQTGQNLSVSLVNAFIPQSKHSLLVQIGNVLKKKLYRILPTEFCIAKIFPEEDIVIINIGATQTCVSLKLEGEVRGISKIPIGINDLVNKISKISHAPRAEIIEHLSEELYLDEKRDFLSVWGESIGISLQEILGTQLCPKYFFIGGGGGNNSFFQEYLEDFPFSKYAIGISHRISFLKEDIAPLLKIMKSIKVEDIQKMPLDMYVLLGETNALISQEWDIVSLSLKHAIEKLGYIRP